LADRKAGHRKFAVLVDPDDTDVARTAALGRLGAECGVDYFFVGGSLVVGDQMEEIIKTLKQVCEIPVILFPGSINQVSPSADALLFLSLISGRNPDLLIGQHVLAAPAIKRSGLEVLPTGYMLIDGGAPTTVSYISNTEPIPRNKPQIAGATAIAGEMLGLKLIYMDAGSGAKLAIPAQSIATVRSQVDIPIIVGGGIREPEAAAAAAQAGADLIVVGNALETNPALAREISIAVHSASQVVSK
jgi:phosphoglycerol geranylgeranyltransferase